MIANTDGQSIGGQLVDALTGAAYTGGVTVYITKDAGIQAIGTVNGGFCTPEGNGYYTYRPTALETNGSLIAFTFVGSGAIPATIQVQTQTPAQVQAIAISSAPGAITVSTLIELAMKRCNYLQQGGTLNAADAEDALSYANLWLDSLSIERLTIPYVARTLFTISSAKGTLANPYSVGLGGDVNVSRPSLPNDLRVRYQNTAVSPTLELPLARLSQQAWEAVPQKDLTAVLPTSYYYNPTYANNLGSLYLWLVPTQTSLQGVVYSPAYLSTFGALSDTITLPPGYTFFIQENLAVFYASTFRENLPIDPNLLQSARHSKDVIQSANVVMADLAVDPAVAPRFGGRYNIFADQNL